MKLAFDRFTRFACMLDRMLPALILLLLLSWQNTVQAGAATWVFNPELVAADGRLLSPVDFCNRGMSAGAERHCGDCQLNNDVAALLATRIPDSRVVGETPQKPVYDCDVSASPEIAYRMGRAPPVT